MRMPIGETPTETPKKKITEKMDQSLLTYPTNNKVLRFYGDIMLLIGSLFTNVGLRYGGVYEYEFEDIEG